MSGSVGVRYGKIETMTIDDNGVTTAVIKTIHDYATTKEIRKYSLTVFADDKKHLLTEVLKLTDKLADDTIMNISFTAEKRNSGSKYKLDVCWTCN